MDKRKLTKPLEVLSRYKYALLVAALGVALLLWPGRETADGGKTDAGGSQPADIERALEEILGKMNGVGQVEVMLTLQSGSELVLAQDATLRYSGSAQAPDDYQRSTDTVQDSGGVVVTREIFPQFRGALVVCDGGGNDAVRLQVVEAVAAVTGLGSYRIDVIKRQSAGE